MTQPPTSAREARLSAAKRSPELATLHDRAGWLGLYAHDAVVEDPVGTPAAVAGHHSRPGRLDDLERFYETFIAASEVRVESFRDLVVGDTVVRDVVLHVRVAGGGRSDIPAILQYDFRDEGGALRVARMRAYWNAGQSGRAMLASGLRGRLSSVLSGIRLFRVLGKDWANRYVEGTKRGVRRDAPELYARLATALAAGDGAALADLSTDDATVTLPGRAPAPLRTFDGVALALTLERPIHSGFVTTARCTARCDGATKEGIAMVDVDPTTKKATSLRLFWE